jgi:hypothetical protein
LKRVGRKEDILGLSIWSMDENGPKTEEKG